MSLTSVMLRFAVALTGSSGARLRWSPVCAGSCRSARCGGNCAPDDRGWRRPAWDYQTLLAATVVDRQISAVTVTDPRHPLCGQRLQVLSLTCGRGPRFIAVALPDGRRRLIRRAATELEHPVQPEQAVARISVRMLLPLARHIRRVVAALPEEATHADTPQPSPTSVCVTAVAPSAPLASVAAPDPGTTGSASCTSAPAPSRGGTSC